MATRGTIFPRRRRLPRLPRQLRLTGILHAAWLDPRSAVQTLQSRVLFTQFRDDPLLVSHLAQQLHHQRLQRFERQAINVSRGGHSQVESTHTRVGASKISTPARAFAPTALRGRTLTWINVVTPHAGYAVRQPGGNAEDEPVMAEDRKPTRIKLRGSSLPDVLGLAIEQSVIFRPGRSIRFQHPT